MASVEDKKNIKKTSQNIVLENRELLKITGVNDVECFNNEAVVSLTELGKLYIRGADLKINKLDLENSSLCIEGTINSLEYSVKGKKKNRSIFRRV